MFNNTLQILHPLRLMVAVLALSIGCDEAAATDVELVEVDGLTVTLVRADRVEGRYTHADATIEFSVQRDPDARTASIRDVDGAPLLESTVTADGETVRLFGGRAVLTGERTIDPDVEGDPDALAELLARPEAAPIEHLRVSLEQAGVDPTLIADPSAATDGVTPRAYWQDGYWVLGPGETRQFGTWTFWTPTNIAFKYGPSEFHSIGCISFWAGAGQVEALCGSLDQLVTTSRSFWGVPVNIYNRLNSSNGVIKNGFARVNVY